MSEAIIVRRRRTTEIIDNGVDLSGVTASPQHVLQGYYYMPNNGRLTPGSMINRGSLTMTIEGGDSQYFSAGYYTGGTITAESSLPPATLKTETITGNTTFTVPSTIQNNTLSVLIFGGGGAGGLWGGGGGWMNRGDIDVTPGQQIQITIGRGGGSESTNVGGTSSFGMYLSANGGQSLNGHGASGGGATGSGSTKSEYGDAGHGYQFGGGGGIDDGEGGGLGGNGGTWGGGGGGCGGWWDNDEWEGIAKPGGSGGTYGGGGGGGAYAYWDISGTGIRSVGCGGNGGTYGGGGGWGAAIANSDSQTRGSVVNHGYRGDAYAYGTGGTYGGNGGYADGDDYNIVYQYRNFIAAERGTNTSTWTNVDMVNGQYLRGWGLNGNNLSYNGRGYGPGGGGGGFGGNGGNVIFISDGYDINDYVIRDNAYCAGGGGAGGGGYGSNGGNGYFTITSGQFDGASGGGGGGYGGDGGDGGLSVINHGQGGGGGGGYGKGARGGDGGNGGGGGGGGYFAPGGNNGGGGGSYGRGGNGGNNSRTAENGIMGGGGGATHNRTNTSRGGDGICIIQYYA